MTTKNFYTLQDFRTKLKPGTFVYPYFHNQTILSPREANYDRLGPSWYSRSPIVRTNKMDSWNKNFPVISDEHLHHFIKMNTLAIKKFKHGKMFYVNYNDISSFYMRSRIPKYTSEYIALNHPDPIGIYVGEILQPTFDHGLEIMKTRVYVKILTLDSQIVWVRV